MTPRSRLRLRQLSAPVTTCVSSVTPTLTNNITAANPIKLSRDLSTGFYPEYRGRCQATMQLSC